MNTLQYKIGHIGAFFGCIHRNVEISWDTKTTQSCRVFWIDLENSKHFLGDQPGVYTLPHSIKLSKSKFHESHKDCFNDLAGIIQFEFESLDKKKGVFFNTPRFHNDSSEAQWISQGPTSGWFIFPKGQIGYWSDLKCDDADKKTNQYPFSYSKEKDKSTWFSEVLGIKNDLSSKKKYILWIQKEKPYCAEILDIKGFPPLAWFPNQNSLESWSYSHNENRTVAFSGKAFSLRPWSYSKVERFGIWEIGSFLSSTTYADSFQDRKIHFEAYGLYGLLAFSNNRSSKSWCPWFFEDWLGRRFRLITKEEKIHFFNYQKNNGWKEIGKTEENYDEACILEDFKGNYWILAKSKDQDIFESVSYDGGQSWRTYKMVLKGGRFPLLVMGQKGKIMRIVLKNNRLLFSKEGSKNWWSACSSHGELQVKEDRFSVLASKDLKESWYLFACLENEDEPSEWISLDECKTWCRVNKE